MAEDSFLTSHSGDFSRNIYSSILYSLTGKGSVGQDSIFDMIPMGIEILECIRNEQYKIKDFHYIYVNRFAQRLSGKPDLVKKTLLTVYPDAIESGLFNLLVKVVETGESVEIRRGINSGDRENWMHVYHHKFFNGVLISYKDITEQKLVEEKLKVAIQFFEQFATTAPDIMYVFDRTINSFLYINDRGVSILQKNQEDKHKKDFDLFQNIVHPDDLQRHKQHLEECSRIGPNEVKEIDLRLKVKDGEWNWFWIRDKAFKSDKEGKVLQIIGVIRDIHTQKMSENALIKSNQELESLNSELKTFNSITGNDFKENLKKVYTSLEFIANNDARYLSNEGRANIRRTQSAIQKMKLLTDDITAYAEILELEPDFSVVNPNEIINRVLNMLSEPIRRTGAKIETMHFPLMFADSFMLTSLIDNLVDNAIKFRKQILSPHIRIKYAQADEINFDARALKDTPYGIISVTDNGIGLEENEAEKIFDLFYRTNDDSKNKGMGIGLALCKRIMSIHNGFITAEGTPAMGATLSCYFPFNQTL